MLFKIRVIHNNCYKTKQIPFCLFLIQVLDILVNNPNNLFFKLVIMHKKLSILMILLNLKVVVNLKRNRRLLRYIWWPRVRLVGLSLFWVLIWNLWCIRVIRVLVRQELGEVLLVVVLMLGDRQWFRSRVVGLIKHRMLLVLVRGSVSSLIKILAYIKLCRLLRTWIANCLHQDLQLAIVHNSQFWKCTQNFF